MFYHPKLNNHWEELLGRKRMIYESINLRVNFEGIKTRDVYLH